MKPTKQEYAEMTDRASPPSPYVRSGIRAFCCGGAICTLGEALFHWYTAAGLAEDAARTTVSVTLIGLAALLTALNVYDNFAKFAGAGSLVPITGFANAMVAPAIEFKQEGPILGVGANMFRIAGPVILYGTFASVLYGVVLWIIRLAS